MKKKILLPAAILIILVVAFIGYMVMNGGEKVVFTDSAGSEIATVNFDGKNEKISSSDNGYSDYIRIALDEAIKLYGESKTDKSDNIKADFFENVSLVKTNFDASTYKKIKTAFEDSDLEEDTPFSSVIVDSEGNILASYSFISESGTTYSLEKNYAGSAIKPLSVYAPAIEIGAAHWSSNIKDAPIKKVVSETEGVKQWPSNASGTYTYENMLLCDAVYKSINTVAVRVLKRVGIEYSMSFLSKKLGVNLETESKLLAEAGEDEIYGNIALGYLADGVSPVDMAGYYQIFMNGGIYTEPHAVVSISDKDGKTTENKPESQRVISSATASVMLKMLEGVVRNGGTGKDAAVEGVSVAGKSGTSDNYYNNWFVGFTPDIVCSVWHGFNDQPKNSASSIFGKIVKQMPVTDSRFKVSKQVRSAVFCNKTGGLQSGKCYDTSVGYYIAKTMPSVCSECGK